MPVPACRPLLSIDVGKKTMAAVVLDGSGDMILRWRTWEVGQSAAAFVASIDFLLKDGWLEPAPRVIVESQPRVNQQMRRFQHYFEVWLAMNGLAPRPVSPRLKLGLLPPSELKTYYRRKKASVAWATAWLASHPQSAEAMAAWEGCGRKKDDLSDCLAQAVASLQLTEKKGKKKGAVEEEMGDAEDADA